MLIVLMSLLCWTQTEGSCSTTVAINGDDVELSVGERFTLNCVFTCLEMQYLAQLQKNSRNQEVSLISVKSTHPNVTLELNIFSATEADGGYYSCKTQPPVTISPAVEIRIADNLTTTNSTQLTNSSHLPSNAGLQGQIWYWMLLGKTAILLLSLASLAVKYKRG